MVRSVIGDAPKRREDLRFLIGQGRYLDDLVFGVFVLNKVMGSVDASVVREHWSGGEDVLGMIQRVLKAADSLIGKDMVAKIKKMMGK